MARTKQLLALDVGAARIGVAMADDAVRIAVPIDHIPVDGNEIARIAELILADGVSTVVIGYPRNQSGDPTQQTEYVEAFAKQLADVDAEIVFQDESLTSVLAEKRLIARGQPYGKGDIDSEAAAIILQDYLEHRL